MKEIYDHSREELERIVTLYKHTGKGLRKGVEQDYNIAREKAIRLGIAVDSLGFTEKINDCKIKWRS